MLRIVTAVLFLQHGTAKFFGFPHVDAFDNMQFASLLGAAGVLEIVGGLLILIGLFTRPVAFILSGFMAVAYFMAHAPQGFYPLLNQGELAVLYCFVFLVSLGRRRRCLERGRGAGRLTRDQQTDHRRKRL